MIEIARNREGLNDGLHLHAQTAAITQLKQEVTEGTQGVRLSGSGLRAAHAGRGHCGNGHGEHHGMGLRIA